MTEKTYTLGDTLPDGTLYLGCVNGVHTSMLPKTEKPCTWDYAMKSYALPNRHEGLFIWELKQLKPDLFKDIPCIWLSETYKSYAFYQWVDDGFQYGTLKARELPVSVVRRFKSFNDLIIPPHQDLPKYKLEIQPKPHFGYRVINKDGDAGLGTWHIADFSWLGDAEFFVKAWELKHD